jgi:hypothetical protein
MKFVFEQGRSHCLVSGRRDVVIDAVVAPRVNAAERVFDRSADLSPAHWRCLQTESIGGAMKVLTGLTPTQPELANAAMSTLELIRACGEAVHASWLPLQSTLACQEQFLGNLFLPPHGSGKRKDLPAPVTPAKQPVRVPATGAVAPAVSKGDLAMEENGVTSDRLGRLMAELATLRAANVELNTELARQQRDGEPAGWREFIELTAGSGSGVANGVTIASLARKLLVATENTRKVLKGHAIPADEVS